MAECPGTPRDLVECPEHPQGLSRSYQNDLVRLIMDINTAGHLDPDPEERTDR
mgnify:FL=1